MDGFTVRVKHGRRVVRFRISWLERTPLRITMQYSIVEEERKRDSPVSPLLVIAEQRSLATGVQVV